MNMITIYNFLCKEDLRVRYYKLKRTIREKPSHNERISSRNKLIKYFKTMDIMDK
jgi:hypothetical protein